MTWTPDLIPHRYRRAIDVAERAYSLPHNLLARVLWQESRFRDDIITGAMMSPKGALGIAQFEPGTAKDLNIDPLDPCEAIPAAAAYLRSLYGAAGWSWRKALAAYNWGIGNVQRKGIDAAPRETHDYYTQILADLAMGWA